jgi:hypothetical protein
MEYLNFELRIGSGNSGRYPVTVIRSPAGETSAEVTFPVDDPRFKRRLEGIEKSRGIGGTRKGGGPLEVSRSIVLPTGRELKMVKDLGSELFEKLFAAEIRSCYRSSLQKAREEKRGLRIRLRIEDPDLAALPWEYLYDEAEGDYFCLSTETPLIRFLELPRPPEPLTTKPPLNILGMIASPADLPSLDVEKEKAQMINAVEHLIEKGFITLSWLEGQTWRALQAAMRKGPWHILHFIGHGAFDDNTGEGAIALVNDDGSTYHLAASNLGRLLAGHHSMRMVVLNSCEGARSSGTDIFSSTGASLIRKGIPAVVSMQYEITDKAALEFSRTFYETIAEGIPIDTALQEARKAINFAMEHSSEWGTPVLHMRAPDGMLFHIDVNGAIFSDRPQASQAKPAESIDTASIQVDTPPPGPADDRGLKILMNKVRQFWVKGVLEQSVQHSALIELGLDNMPEMVDSPWGSMPVSADQSIAEVFNEVGRSMLILGEPGTGKTTLLLTLARELLNQYENTSGLPLPVVFNLSSWTHSGKTLPEWLADELSTKYMIPRKIGGTWVKNNRLLLLLDGLDEVGADRRNDCVSTINEFIQGTAIMGVVVCCRFKEYIELNSKLIMNGAIRLRLLSKEKIMDYMSAAGPSYSGLHELLKKDSSFLTLAETPFMLSLMMRTYQHIEADQLASGELQSMNAKRRQLMDAYVKRQFRMVEKGGVI